MEPTKNILQIKISASAISVLARSDTAEPFVRSLISIAEGTYRPDKPICSNPFEISALDIIYNESREAREKKVRAGEARQIQLKGNPHKEEIKIPDIQAPQEMKSLEIAGIIIRVDVILRIRYIMLMRNYGKGETRFFLNDTFSKKVKGGCFVPEGSEIIERAFSWDNYGRSQRFPFCPQMYDFVTLIMNKSTPLERGILLDLSLDIKIVKQNEFVICGSKRVLNILKKFSQDFREIVMGNYPDATFITKEKTFE